MARNAWFQRRAVKALDGLNTKDHEQIGVVFAYSYAALGILRWGRKKGLKTVLGQIDPGPREEEIVEAEYLASVELEPIWSRAPAEYWKQWRQECELADEIIVNSQWSFNCLVATGISAVKLRIVPLAYQEPPAESRVSKQYPAVFTKDRPLRVLFLGQFSIRKGAARLLAAASALRNSPVEFSIVGRVQLGVGQEDARWPNVRWHDLVPHQEVGEHYKRADVFILPTFSDGFALTQLEALAYRLPLIVSRRCGEVVRDGIDGLILKEPGESAIVEAINALLDDSSLLQKLSDAASVRPDFSLVALQRHLLALFS
jgi:glycosyltransferase involved in cell wall biosynthesis